MGARTRQTLSFLRAPHFVLRAAAALGGTGKSAANRSVDEVDHGEQTETPVSLSHPSADQLIHIISGPALKNGQKTEDERYCLACHWPGCLT